MCADMQALVKVMLEGGESPKRVTKAGEGCSSAAVVCLPEEGDSKQGYRGQKV